MMMAVIAFLNQLEPGSSIAKIESFDHAHLLEQTQRAINGRQIALVFRQCPEDFFRGERMRRAAEEFENGPPRRGHLARLPPQSLGQVRQRRASGPERMAMRAHGLMELKAQNGQADTNGNG